MTTIREKISKISLPIHLPICDQEVAFNLGRAAAADIAEAEVQRLEEVIDFLAKDVTALTDEKERLENELALYRMDMRSGGTGS